MMRKGNLAVLFAAASVFAAGSVSAQEVTLKAVTALATNTAFGEVFNAFVDRVNTTGKGKLQIRLIGGPEAMPPFEAGSALQSGVLDIAHLPGNYYEKLVPAATAVGLIERDTAELRKNGGYAELERLHESGMNAHVLALWGYGIKFHFYTTKPVTHADLAGFKIRVAPGFQEVVRALGGTSVQTAPGEVYTALERGVIDGYTWPLWGVLDLGWQKVTKYRVEPGWRTVAIGVLINSDRYKKLSGDQRRVLDDAGVWFEDYSGKLIERRNAEERDKQAKAGIKTIELSSGDASKVLSASREAGWDAIKAKAPKEAPKLRQLFAR
jgi:TRAP-type C4-dicarboxylate transport system substrate-binding protein